MTMLAHGRGPRERLAYSWRGRHNVTAAYLPIIKRFFIRALMMLAAICTIAAIMAIKIAIYLPRLIHH
jgi:hypothetical protein